MSRVFGEFGLSSWAQVIRACVSVELHPETDSGCNENYSDAKLKSCSHGRGLRD